MNTMPAPSDRHGPAHTAVVLMHGLCSTPDELLAVHAPLRRAGYTVEPLQIPGYSFDANTQAQRATRYEQWIDAVEAHVDRMRTTCKRVILVGISAGSSLALGAAIRCGTRVDGLVLMSTSLRLDGWAIPRMHRLLPLALYTPLGRWWKYRERHPYGVKNERVRAWIVRELNERRVSRAGSATIDRSHLRENDRLIRHVRRKLHEVRCPNVLALHAREDEVASPANLDILARGLRSDTLRTVVVDNSYHMITIDNDRQRVVRETVDFADSIAAALA
jgi:carboxylesterase